MGEVDMPLSADGSCFRPYTVRAKAVLFGSAKVFLTLTSVSLGVCAACSNTDADNPGTDAGSDVQVGERSLDGSDAGSVSDGAVDWDASAADGSDLDASYDAEPVPTSACGAVTQRRPDEGHVHFLACTPITYNSNPPSSGTHYADIPAFGVYSVPLPRGYWVHTLEHGAIVITYNCPDGCADEVAAATQFLNTLPYDPLCELSGYNSRAILTPDPKLDTRWAASAWDYTLRSSCFEADVFRDFYNAHYNRGRENSCNWAFDARTDGGALNLPAHCGE